MAYFPQSVRLKAGNDAAHNRALPKGKSSIPQLLEEVKDMNALHIAHTTIEGVQTDDYQTCRGIVFGKRLQTLQMSGQHFLYRLDLNSQTCVTYDGIHFKSGIRAPESQLLNAVGIG